MDVMEGAYAAPGSRSQKKQRRAADKSGGYQAIDTRDPAEVSKEINRLEAEMFEQARNLAFEEAAATRDQIAELKEVLLRGS